MIGRHACRTRDGLIQTAQSRAQVFEQVVGQIAVRNLNIKRLLETQSQTNRFDGIKRDATTEERRALVDAGQSGRIHDQVAVRMRLITRSISVCERRGMPGKV